MKNRSHNQASEDNLPRRFSKLLSPFTPFCDRLLTETAIAPQNRTAITDFLKLRSPLLIAHQFDQLRDVVENDIPQRVDVYAIVLVGENITHTGNIFPGDIRIRVAEVIG